MTDNQAQNSIVRNPSGRFVRTTGRPLGAKNKVSQAALEQVKAMKEGALQNLWEAVCAKERWAIEYVLNRILPATRTVELEALTPLDVESALAHGDISPEEGKALSGTLKNLREVENIEIIEARVTELEAAVDKDHA